MQIPLRSGPAGLLSDSSGLKVTFFFLCVCETPVMQCVGCELQNLPKEQSNYSKMKLQRCKKKKKRKVEAFKQ